jgi:hypothetical protein
MDTFLNNLFELVTLDMCEQIIFHRQEVCTSSLQYFTVHLYAESSHCHDARCSIQGHDIGGCHCEFDIKT